MGREAFKVRKTRETSIELALHLDGEGTCHLEIPLPFLAHMLDQVARHALFDLKISAKGDTEIDDHHTVEDVGIVFGEAFKDALGEKVGIRRFGEATVPLDEALAQVVVDIDGRGGLHYVAQFPTDRVGTFEVDLVREFFTAFTRSAGVTLHMTLLRGTNAHHMIEAMFKAFARALDEASQLDPRRKGIPSTKGVL